LVAIGLLAVRSGRVAPWRRLAITTLVTWLAVSLPWLVVNSDGLLSVYRSWWRAGASYGSLWMVSGLLGHGLPQGRVTILVMVGWVGAVVVGTIFALSLNRRPAVAEVSLVMLVIVVVTGKAVPVQAALWLLPLIALVGLKWRDHLIWAGCEATYFVAVWLYIAGLSKPDRGLPSGGYSAILLLRIAAWLYVLVQVWRVARSRAPVPTVESAGQESAGQESAGQESAGQVQEEVGQEPVGALRLAQAVEPERLDLDQDEIDPLAGPMDGAPDQVLVRFS
jgi:hypothetical protein